MGNNYNYVVAHIFTLYIRFNSHIEIQHGQSPRPLAEWDRGIMRAH